MAFVVAAFSTEAHRRVAGDALAAAGHTCVFFRTGLSAIAEVRAGTPDVLVLESRLSDMTAARMRAVLAAHAATADLPIVVCDPAAGPDGLADAVRAALAAPPPGREHPLDSDRPVLLVEDDDGIAEPLIEGLARYGIRVDRVGTGAAALTAPPAAMVLLDLGLPDIDGIEVCRQLRQSGDVPIIMLTARGDEADRVAGLELGADDYLGKPFSVRELVARMRAVSRRTGPALA